MWSNARSAWKERRLVRELRKDMAAFDDLGPPARPQRHKGKDFLGAVVTLAIAGAILVELTNGLASQCGRKATPGTGNARGCTGLAAFADQARGAVNVTVAALAPPRGMPSSGTCSGATSATARRRAVANPRAPRAWGPSVVGRPGRDSGGSGDSPIRSRNLR